MTEINRGRRRDRDGHVGISTVIYEASQLGIGAQQQWTTIDNFTISGLLEHYQRHINDLRRAKGLPGKVTLSLKDEKLFAVCTQE